MKTGLIGYGYWGPNFARIINELDDINLEYCADLSNASLENVKNKYPKIKVTNDYNDILNDKDIKAVFIVTPVNTHYKIAKDSLKAGKHVFLEKPLTASLAEAKELVDFSKEKKLKLMVGHVFLYNSAVNYIKGVIDAGKIGKLRYLQFQRRNLGVIRNDVNVLWDLAPHDISMMLYWIKEKPLSVFASGEAYLHKERQEVVSAVIKFENDIFVNMILSWLDPIKIRETTIVGEKKMILFDDVEQSEKVKIFDKNINIIKNTHDVGFKQFQIAVHSGNISVPSISQNEPLKDEIKHFINCIKYNRTPLTSGEEGVQVVAILEALSISLQKGKIIKLND